MKKRATRRDPDPKVYLSKSEGKFRVIDQGMPISADKKTAEEALAVARHFKLKVSDLVWDGDKGAFVKSRGPARRPSQEQMFSHAQKRNVDAMKTFNEIMTGPNPLTQAEIRKMIEKRPAQYAFMRAWLKPERDANQTHDKGRLRRELGPIGNAVWHLPKPSPWIIYWNGPGARLVFGSNKPGSQMSPIEYPGSDGNYRTLKEATAAVAHFWKPTGKTGRDHDKEDYVLVYGGSGTRGFAVSNPFVLKSMAISEAKALSRPDSYGEEVRVGMRKGGRVIEIGRAKNGVYRET